MFDWGLTKTLLKNMLKHSQMEIDFLFMTIIGRVNPYFAVQQHGMKTMMPIKKVKSTDGLDITIYKNQYEQIYGFKVGGYLNLAQMGDDIYNAVFSQIFIGTINSIAVLTNIQNFVLEKETGFIRFVIPDIKNEDERILTLLDSMLVQVATVMELMGKENLDDQVKFEFKMNP